MSMLPINLQKIQHTVLLAQIYEKGNRIPLSLVSVMLSVNLKA